MTAKAPVTTVAEYDQAIEKEAKGLPQVGAEKPLSSIVKTVGGTPPPNDPPAASDNGEPEGLPAPAGSEAASSGPAQQAPAGDPLPTFPAQPSGLSPQPLPAGSLQAGSGKQSSAEPIKTDVPVAEAAKPAESLSSPVSKISPADGGAAPPKITNIAAAEASPVKTVSGDGSNVVPTADVSAKDDTLAPPQPGQPKKSISEKVKETWKFWFGD
jgi:hypothetical protein